jgi:hypothetical protein
VFSNHNSWAKCINNADELIAKALLLAVTGGAIRLAWVATANNVDAPIAFWREGSHVVMPTDAWPVLCEHSSAIVVFFNLPFALKASPFKTKIKAANAREQRTESQLLGGIIGGRHRWFVSHALAPVIAR